MTSGVVGLAEEIPCLNLATSSECDISPCVLKIEGVKASSASPTDT